MYAYAFIHVHVPVHVHLYVYVYVCTLLCVYIYEYYYQAFLRTDGCGGHVCFARLGPPPINGDHKPVWELHSAPIIIMVTDC